MHTHHFTGVVNGDIKTLDIMMGQLRRQQLPVADKSYRDRVLACSSNRTLDLNLWCIVATHGINSNSHTHNRAVQESKRLCFGSFDDFFAFIRAA